MQNEIPPELMAALKAAGLTEFFADCTPAHRREYIQWIAGAKKPETRAARSQQAAKMIAERRAKEIGK